MISSLWKQTALEGYSGWHFLSPAANKRHLKYIWWQSVMVRYLIAILRPKKESIPGLVVITKQDWQIRRVSYPDQQINIVTRKTREEMSFLKIPDKLA